MRKFHYILILTLISLIGCRELYEPEILEIDFGYLVVEGFIEIGPGDTEIRLSQTTTIYDSISSVPVSNAEVFVEGQQQGNWRVMPLGNGNYSLAGALPEGQNYRLIVYLDDTRKYESEWIEPLYAPEIDQIFFERSDDGVTIYADGKGDVNSQYFLWTANETWRFQTPFISGFEWDSFNNRIVPRGTSVNFCYSSQVSQNLILTDAAKTQNREIKNLEILRIPINSEKLGWKYSVEVRQRPIDARAHQFWDIIKRNSEDIGGLFSPMPSIVESNLYNVNNPSEPVIGFVGVGKSERKRIFIETAEVRPWVVSVPEYEICEILEVEPSRYQEIFSGGRVLPLQEIPLTGPPGPPPGFYGARRVCADCRERGTLNKPAFWVD
ncbi:DUF4249 domain-containing protein [Litoribacter populi]|uniref:DUF4249 domain-containing protein n=1 Tax=Litoribacter populi TaxID=2598460 RepID=UPI00117CAD12|nr:DUF4249 domain-containing protein [Litoribacter populi]